MFLLQSTKDDTKHYIRKELTTIGRQQGDIVLNDNGVSRSHAELIVEANKLYLISLKEQLRTSINNIIVTHRIRNNLKAGDVVNIGMSFEFSVNALEFRVATSSISENQKIELAACLKQINTKLSSSFRPDCTHLVVPELCPSIKVICAVILNIPMVTLEFFKQICDTSKEFPKEDDFRPVIKSSIHEVKDSYFRPNEKRKTLFQGKTFVFVDEKSGKPMKTMISLASGEYSPFDATLISEYRRTPRTPKYIIIHCDSPESLPVSKAIKTAYNEVCAALATNQWRAVPLQEIAFALIKCCCDVDCNPAFNRARNLLRVVDSQDSPNRRAPLAHSTQVVDCIIAKETQTQAILRHSEEDVVIPPSFENELGDQLNVNSKRTASSQALARRNLQNKTLRVNPFEEDFTPITPQPKKRTKLSIQPQVSVNSSTQQQTNQAIIVEPNLISSNEAIKTSEIRSDTSILTITKRKRDAASVAAQENQHVSKKAAVENIVLSDRSLSGDSASQSSWLSKSENGGESKRKYEDMMKQLEDDGELSKPIKMEVVEPRAKRKKSFDLFPTTKSTNVFEMMENQEDDDTFKNDMKKTREEYESHTQTMEAYFQSIIKSEDTTETVANATLLSGKWNRRLKVEKQENTEDQLNNETLMKEYAEKYFRASIRSRLQNLDIGNAERSLADLLTGKQGAENNVVNYKKFRKTQHIPITLKKTLIQLV